MAAALSPPRLHLSTRTESPPRLHLLPTARQQQRALETLPDEMETLQAEIAVLEGILTDPELYAKDAERFQQSTEALTGKQSRLAAAEEEWLELELLREELEG